MKPQWIRLTRNTRSDMIHPLIARAGCCWSAHKITWFNMLGAAWLSEYGGDMDYWTREGNGFEKCTEEEAVRTLKGLE